MAKKPKKSSPKKSPAKKLKPKATAAKKKAPVKTAAAKAAPPRAKTGDVCWTELNTTDQNGSMSFYQKLFGWKSKPMSMGSMGTYQVMSNQNGKDFGGITKSQDPAAPPQWITYFWTADTDTSVADVERLGGRVIAPPMDIPGAGRIAVVQDPAGAIFALLHDPSY